MSAKIPSLAKVRRAWNAAKRARAKAREMRDFYEEIKLLYLLTHPLQSKNVQAILEAYDRGEPICCEPGVKTLRTLGLDDCWIGFLNEWAYGHLGCDGQYRPGGRLHGEGRANLADFLGTCTFAKAKSE